MMLKPEPRLFCTAACIWLGSQLLVMLAVVASLAIPPTGLAKTTNKTPVARAAGNWDGQWYERIVTDGYTFRTNHRSSIVFFPAYPLLARGLLRAGVPLAWAMLGVSNLASLGVYAVFTLYIAGRMDEQNRPHSRRFALLSLGLLPSTFFFHMAYTESLTLLLLLAAMYGMHRRWNPVGVALIIGAATAVRSTGVALLVPFAWYLWQFAKTPVESAEQGFVPRGRGTSVVRLVAFSPLMLLGCWGLIAFMVWQRMRFGTPVAFMQAQFAWHQRPPIAGSLRQTINLATFESIRSTYVPGNKLYWNLNSCRNVPLLNIFFVNPLFFVGTAVLIAIGRHRRWLSTPELLLSAMLLAIPYLAQSNRQGMVSEARFTSIAFPAYLVMGYLLAGLPRRVAYTLLATGGLMMMSYTALFCAGYPFF